MIALYQDQVKALTDEVGGKRLSCFVGSSIDDRIGASVVVQQLMARWSRVGSNVHTLDLTEHIGARHEVLGCVEPAEEPRGKGLSRIRQLPIEVHDARAPRKEH